MTSLLIILAAIFASVATVSFVLWASMRSSDRKLDAASKRARAAGLGQSAYAAGQDSVGSSPSESAGGDD